MSEKKSDILIPNYDGALIDNYHVKAGLFVVKTIQQRNSVIKQLYRTLDPNTTTICHVSAEGTMYELISNPASEGTTDQDWKKLDFGVSDILIAKGNWDADNTAPVLSDTLAIGAGNDFYILTGAATPIEVQFTGLFRGQSVTFKDGDWIISNGTQWFVSSAPIGWDSISDIPQTILDYVTGAVIGHTHGISDVTGLQDALDLKFDISNVGDHGTAFTSLPDGKLIDVFLVKANFYQKSDTYNQTEVDALISGINPLTSKGDLLSHNGTSVLRIDVGSDGQMIVADSTSPQGWKWDVNQVSGALTRNDSETKIAVINSTTKIIEWRHVDTIADGVVAIINDLTTGGTDKALSAEQGVVLKGLVDGKQETLISATNIKTINGTSLLGSGDLAVQEVLVSATNIKTINGSSILGSGDLVVSGGIGVSSPTELLWNNGGSLDGLPEVFWNNTTKILTMSTSHTAVNGVLEVIQTNGTQGGALMCQVNHAGANSVFRAFRNTSLLTFDVRGNGETSICNASGDKLGVFNTAPAAQQTHIVDATDAASAITQLNLLLAQFAIFGFQASS